MDVAVEFKDVLASARKALVAGVGAGIAAVVPLGLAALSDGHIDSTEASGMLTAFVVALGTVGYATYKVSNKPLTGTTDTVKGEAGPDSGTLPAAEDDDASLLDEDSDNSDTSDIQPLVDDSETEDAPKHLAE